MEKQEPSRPAVPGVGDPDLVGHQPLGSVGRRGIERPGHRPRWPRRARRESQTKWRPSAGTRAACASLPCSDGSGNVTGAAGPLPRRGRATRRHRVADHNVPGAVPRAAHGHARKISQDLRQTARHVQLLSFPPASNATNRPSGPEWRRRGVAGLDPARRAPSESSARASRSARFRSLPVRRTPADGRLETVRSFPGPANDTVGAIWKRTGGPPPAVGRRVPIRDKRQRREQRDRAPREPSRESRTATRVRQPASLRRL